MPLNYQHVPIKFQGLAQKTDDKDGVIGQLTTCENMSLQKTAVLKKRYGFPFKFSAATNADIVGISGFNDSIVYHQNLKSGVWTSGTRVESDAINYQLKSIKSIASLVEDINIYDTASSFAQYWDVAEGSSTVCVISPISASSYRVNFYTKSDNVLVYSYRVITSGNIYPRVFLVGTDFWVYSPGSIDATLTKFNSAGQQQLPTYTTSTLVGTAWNGVVIGTDIYCFVEKVSGDIALFKIATLTTSKGSETLLGVATGTTQRYCRADIDTDGTNLFLTYPIATGFEVKKFDTAFNLLNTSSYSAAALSGVTYTRVSVSANFVHTTITNTTSNGAATPVVDQTWTRYYRWNKSNLGSPLSTYMPNAYVNSSILVNGDEGYTYLTYANTSENTSFCLASLYFLSPNVGAGNIIPQKIGVYHSFGRTPLNLWFAKTTRAITGPTYFAVKNGEKAGLPILVLNSIELQAANNVISEQLNSVNYSNQTGNLSFFDGKSFKQASVPYIPSQPFLVSPSTGSGTWFYCYIVEYTDRTGNIGRSAPSQILTTTALGNTIHIPIPPFEYVNRIVLFRTLDAGSVFHRVDEIDYVNSAPGVLVLQYADGKSDSTIAANPTLYTTGGVIENTPLPVTNLFAQNNDRLYLVDEQTGQLWISKPLVQGEQVSFSDSLTVRLPQGKPKAIASFDDKIILFTQDAVFAAAGVGFDELGGGGLSDWQRVGFGIGAVTQLCVQVFDAGVLFQSEKGVWLLSRGLQVSYLGAPIEDFSNKTFVGSLHLRDRHQIWLWASDGTVVVWDYFHQFFSNWTGLTAKSCALVNGVPTMGGAGYVWQESKSSFVDNIDTQYRCKIQTQWIDFAEIGGFQRVRKINFFGDTKATATLTATLSYDFNGISETFTIPTATITNLQNAFEFQLRPKIQRSEAVQVALEFTTDNQGVELSTMTAEIGVKPGTYRGTISKRIKGN